MNVTKNFYPDMPPALTAETDEQYIDRLTGADGTARVPYNHHRRRQCSLGYHNECTDPHGLDCQCPCHSAWPSMDYIRNICKIGQGAACCRYLTMSADGWSCEKTSSLKAVLDARVAQGTINARGDNCEGRTTS